MIEAELEALLDRPGVRVNCGARHRPREGWRNFDVEPGWPGVEVADLRERWPLEDGVAGVVFGDNFLEHLKLEGEAPAFFSQARRALEPGGLLAMVVPCLDELLHERNYADDVWCRQARDQHLYECEGVPLRELVISTFAHGWGHRALYGRAMLEWLLRDQGFVEVRAEVLDGRWATMVGGGTLPR